MMGPAMSKLLKGAKPGRCPCCRRVFIQRSRRTQVLCGRAKCRAKYQQAYQADHPRSAALRTVIRVEPHPISRRRVLVLLDCGHHVDMPRSHAAWGYGRKHCATCRSFGVSAQGAIKTR